MTRWPSTRPSGQPSAQPTNKPTKKPTLKPTPRPSRVPTFNPTNFPTERPRSCPSGQPTSFPSSYPSLVIERLQTINLGTSAPFVLFASSSVTVSSTSNTSTVFGGNIGSSFGQVNIIGSMYEFQNVIAGASAYVSRVGDSISHEVIVDLINAFNDGIYRVNPAPILLSKVYKGVNTFTPGLYTSNVDVNFNGQIILDAEGYPGTIFVFKTNGNFAFGANMILQNGAVLDNIFWLARGNMQISVVNGTSSNFLVGTFISSGDAIVNSGSVIQGRVFSTSGSITVYNSFIAIDHKTPAPSFAPTSLPTVDFNDYTQAEIYSNFISTVNVYRATNTTKTYQSFSFKGMKVVGNESQYMTVMSSIVNIPVDYFYISKIVAIVEMDDYSKRTNASATFVCNDVSKVNAIVNLLINSLVTTNPESNEFVTCSGHRWKVFSCGQTVSFCIDCTVPFNACNANTCPEANSYMLSPIGTGCSTSTAAYSVLQFTFATLILYPEFKNIKYMITRTTASLQLNVTIPGTIYCAALIHGYNLLSPSIIKQLGSSFVNNNINVLVNITIPNLSPSTAYDIYCYSEDFLAHTMPLNIVQTTLKQVTTPCCRYIYVTSAFNSVLEYPSSLTTTERLVTFQISSAPTHNVTLSVGILSLSCSSGFKQDVIPIAVPNTFYFTSLSKDLSGSFKIRGSRGCYNISITAVGKLEKYTGAYLVPFNILSVPTTPYLSSAVFSNMGTILTVSFDSATDMGAGINLSNYTSSWNCSTLFKFSGSLASTCIWITNYQVQMINAKLYPGMILMLRKLRIRPFCPSDQICNYNLNQNASSVTITIPSNPVIPIASLSAANTIGGCDNVVLDPTGSSGNGGLPWKSVIWSCSSQDMGYNNINDFLAKSSTQNGVPNTNNILTVARSMFDVGVITISLSVTNYFGGSATASIKFTIQKLINIPSVSIVGSSLVSLARNVPLQLISSCSVTSCAGVSNVALNYDWKVYQGLQQISQLTNVAKDVRQFKLNGYGLNLNQEYTFQVTCSLKNDSSTYSTAAVAVNVISSGVTSVIVGGSLRTVNIASGFVIDGSNSQDLDFPAISSSYSGPTRSVSFSWSCLEFYPNYGSACGVNLPNSSIVHFGKYNSSCMACLKPNKQYMFTLVVTNSAGSTAKSTTTISTSIMDTPVITMSSAALKYNIDNKIILSGQVQGLSDFQVVWSYNGGVLPSNWALTATQKNFSTGVINFDLTLAPNIFLTGLSYTFALQAKYLVGLSNYSIGQITVVTNSPPEGGSLTVSPLSGRALNTTFSLQTFSWVDDPNDYPIIYSMDYYTTDSTKYTTLKVSSVVSYANNVLIGQGLATTNYKVTCEVFATDTYGSSGQASTTIIVLPPLSTTGISTALGNQLSIAFTNGDGTQVSQVIGAVTETLNAVNCTVPTSCALLNRLPCKLTPNTCSSCSNGFIGVTGDSNVACRSPTALGKVNDRCNTNSDCSTSLCAVQGNVSVCKLPSKTCPVGLNGHVCNGASSGLCKFIKSNGS